MGQLVLLFVPAGGGDDARDAGGQLLGQRQVRTLEPATGPGRHERDGPEDLVDAEQRDAHERDEAELLDQLEVPLVPGRGPQERVGHGGRPARPPGAHDLTGRVLDVVAGGVALLELPHERRLGRVGTHGGHPADPVVGLLHVDQAHVGEAGHSDGGQPLEGVDVARSVGQNRGGVEQERLALALGVEKLGPVERGGAQLGQPGEERQVDLVARHRDRVTDVQGPERAVPGVEGQDHQRLGRAPHPGQGRPPPVALGQRSVPDDLTGADACRPGQSRFQRDGSGVPRQVIDVSRPPGEADRPRFEQPQAGRAGAEVGEAVLIPAAATSFAVSDPVRARQRCRVEPIGLRYRRAPHRQSLSTRNVDDLPDQLGMPGGAARRPLRHHGRGPPPMHRPSRADNGRQREDEGQQAGDGHVELAGDLVLDVAGARRWPGPAAGPRRWGPRARPSSRMRRATSSTPLATTRGAAVPGLVLRATA